MTYSTQIVPSPIEEVGFQNFLVKVLPFPFFFFFFTKIFVFKRYARAPKCKLFSMKLFGFPEKKNGKIACGVPDFLSTKHWHPLWGVSTIYLWCNRLWLIDVSVSIYSVYPSTFREKNASSQICLDGFLWYLDKLIIRWGQCWTLGFNFAENCSQWVTLM